jgi:hypothetical protein
VRRRLLPGLGAAALLAEILRISFGTRAVGWDNLVYGVLLVLFIIFLPRGILGSLLALRSPGPTAWPLCSSRRPQGRDLVTP